MLQAIPWSEFVACPDLQGMILQIRRSKRQGDLWGEIGQIRFDDGKLVIHLSKNYDGDPRENGKEVTGVESVTISPSRPGPVYTGHIAFAMRDLRTGCECFIRSRKVATTSGRKREIVAISDRRR